MTSFHRASELVLASNRGTEKQIRLPFSPAGGNLFNISNVGLDKSAKWKALVPIRIVFSAGLLEAAERSVMRSIDRDNRSAVIFANDCPLVAGNESQPIRRC